MVFDRRTAAPAILAFLLLASPTTSLSTSASRTAPSPGPSNKSVPGLTGGMDYARLGESDLIVSKVCMGTMTFGQQNTPEEGVEQLSAAFDNYGINFLDTAEMYPVPTTAETQGATDRTVAQFLKTRPREDVILATKVSGRSDRITWLREDGSGAMVSRAQILESVRSSLKRLGTDYVDLLQIHWPDRYVPMFGMTDFDPSLVRECVAFEEQLETLNELVEEGLVRYVGVSNETPYGVSSMIHLAQTRPELYARIVSIQNSYSLVVRKDYEAGLAETCFHHNVGLLAYSPLAGGVLTGKYSREKVDANARLNMFPGFMDRYLGSQNEMAVQAYAKIAKDAGLTPAQLALSWCYHKDHVCSSIIGATSMAQLHENIKSYDIRLDDEVKKKINEVYKKFVDPTKF